MANPKQRHTKHRRDRARKQYDTALQNMQECPKCQARILSHRVCPKCGTYKGKEMINTAPKLSAKGGSASGGKVKTAKKAA